MIKTGDIIENPINQKKEPMTIGNFSAPTIGWVAIVTGVLSHTCSDISHPDGYGEYVLWQGQ